MTATEPSAQIWYCGDDCDCTQPQIVTRTQRPVPSGGFAYDTTVLWEGEFLTETYAYTTEELEKLHYQPLREACKRFGIPLPDELRDNDG